MLDAVSVNGKPTAVGASPAIVDTGTTLIVGERRAVEKFYSSIPDAQDASETIGEGFFTGTSIVDCGEQT